MLRISGSFFGVITVVQALFAANPAGALYIKEFAAKQDFKVGNHERTGFVDDIGGLVLLDTIDCVPILWIPSRQTNAVLKIDSRTGRQLGVYRVGPKGGEWNPCAVAADPLGNAYIACSCPGRSGKIVRIRSLVPGDTNGDGIIRTSTDADGNGIISSNEVLDWCQDDCVDMLVDVGIEAEPSALTFDSDGTLWVALEGKLAVAQVDVQSRALGAFVTLPGRPSGLWADGGGSIWVLSRRDHALYRISTLARTVSAVYDLGDSSPAGMCIDFYGRVWVADEYGALIVVHPDQKVLLRYATDYCGGFAGIAIDKEGDLWASCPVKGLVTHFSVMDGSVIDEIPVSGSPRQLCFDSDGTLWVLNEESNRATGIDTADCRISKTVPTLPDPQSNTSFSSNVYVRGIPSKGAWTVLIDAGIKGAAWGTITWEAEENGGQVEVEARTADTPGELSLSTYVAVRNGEILPVADGRYLALRVTLTRGPRWSPVVRRIRVEGKNRPPDTSNAVAVIDSSKPQINGCQPVSITGIVDPDGDPFVVKITSVTFIQKSANSPNKNEEAQALGIGNSTVWLSNALLRTNTCNVSFQAVDSHGAVVESMVQITLR